jgi:hypothetical protein
MLLLASIVPAVAASYPAAFLKHPYSNAWPWTSPAHDDNFRVLAAFDTDGEGKLYDTKFAASLFTWRDWVNDVNGGICIGGPPADFRHSTNNCNGGSKKQVIVTAFDMQLGGKPATDLPLLKEFFTTACKEAAAVRAHAFVMPWNDGIVKHLGERITSLMKNFTYTEALAKQLGCSVPIVAPGSFNPQEFMGYGYFIQASIPPVTSWMQASLDSVFLRDDVKTYGIFDKEGLGLAAALKQVTQMTIHGQLGPGYTGKTEVCSLFLAF